MKNLSLASKSVLFRSALYSGIALINRMSGIVVVPVLANTLDSASVGQWYAYLGVLGAASVLGSLSAHKAIMRFFHEHDERGRLDLVATAFVMTVVGASLVGLLLAVLAAIEGSISSSISMGALWTPLIVTFLARIPFEAFAQVVLRCYESDNRFVLTSAFHSCLLVGSTIVCALHFKTTVAVAWSQAAVCVMMAPIYQMQIRRYLGGRPRYQFARMLFGHSTITVVIGAISWLYAGGDRLLVGALRGEAQLAVYGLTATACSIVAPLITGVQTVLSTEHYKALSQGGELRSISRNLKQGACLGLLFGVIGAYGATVYVALLLPVGVHPERSLIVILALLATLPTYKICYMNILYKDAKAWSIVGILLAGYSVVVCGIGFTPLSDSLPGLAACFAGGAIAELILLSVAASRSLGLVISRRILFEQFSLMAMLLGNILIATSTSLGDALAPSRTLAGLFHVSCVALFVYFYGYKNE